MSQTKRVHKNKEKKNYKILINDCRKPENLVYEFIKNLSLPNGNFFPFFLPEKCLSIWKITQWCFSTVFGIRFYVRDIIEQYFQSSFVYLYPKGPIHFNVFGYFHESCMSMHIHTRDQHKCKLNCAMQAAKFILFIISIRVSIIPLKFFYSAIDP